MRKVATFTAEICMAGDISHARQVLRKECAVGLCVTLTPADYIYTGGMESKFIVRLINYPRFPATQDDILSLAFRLAESLLVELAQQSFTIITPEETYWHSEKGEA